MIDILRQARQIFTAQPNFTAGSDEIHVPRQDKGLLFDRFGQALPYTAFDQEHNLFPIEGKEPGQYTGLGFCIEVMPQLGADKSMIDQVAEVIRSASVPVGTGIQVTSFGSPDISYAKSIMAASTVTPEQVRPNMRILNAQAREADYRARMDQAGVLQTMNQRLIDYYQKATVEALFPHFNIRFRNYRAFWSVVFPSKDPLSEKDRAAAVNYRQKIINALSQYYMFGHVWNADDFLSFMALVLNPSRMLSGEIPQRQHDVSKQLRYQIINHDTRIHEEPDHIEFWTKADRRDLTLVRALSVSNYPREFSLSNMRKPLGGQSSLMANYPCPFMVTMGMQVLDYEGEKGKTLIKAARAQQTAESPIAKFLPNAQDINQDWKYALASFENGTGLCQMYHQVLLFAKEDAIDVAEEAARNIWRDAGGFELVTDTNMQKQGLMGTMPMMLDALLQKDYQTGFRTTKRTSYNAANLMPLIAEWKGTPPRDGERVQRPLLMLVGRQGQMIPVDPFANTAGNYNGCVVGASGSGKSAFCNMLVLRTLAIQGRVWVIDVGGSYAKLCEMLGGQYIRFDAKSKLSLDPFALVGIGDNTDEDDRLKFAMLKSIVSKMISPSKGLEEYQMSQLDIHLGSVLDDAKLSGITPTLEMLANSLINNCSTGGPNPMHNDPEWAAKIKAMPFEERQRFCEPRVRDMGVQLMKFTSVGSYGDWFANGCNINFDSNFIVLELEELNNLPELRSVILMIVMFLITNEMYLGDRTQNKLVLIDEAWDLMSSGGSADFIEAGYRRARKYEGAFWTATQGVNDYFKNATSMAAFENADCFFMLRQKPEVIDTLAQNNKLSLTESNKALLKSVTTIQNKFAEVFVRIGDMPQIVGRLFFDPYTLKVASSKGPEVEAIKRYRAQGMPLHEAIDQVVKDSQGFNKATQMAMAE